MPAFRRAENQKLTNGIFTFFYSKFPGVFKLKHPIWFLPAPTPLKCNFSFNGLTYATYWKDSVMCGGSWTLDAGNAAAASFQGDQWV